LPKNGYGTHIKIPVSSLTKTFRGAETKAFTNNGIIFQERDPPEARYHRRPGFLTQNHHFPEKRSAGGKIPPETKDFVKSESGK
jgi:hypothetical protein